MRVRNRGFALVLVLLAAAAVFALALQAAALSRAATIESRVMVDRGEYERGARSAAAMALVGLGTTVDRFAQQTGGAGAGGQAASGPGGGGGEEEKPRIELPAILKEILGEKADDLEKGAREAAGGPNAGDGGGITGRVERGRRGERLSVTYLPEDPVRIRVSKDGPAYLVTLRDSAALLDVNAAEREQLRVYFVVMGLPPEDASAVAAQIVDWRDEDNIAEPGGAESDAPAYQERGVRCRNAPLMALEELKFLPGMTAEMFERVRGGLTVGGDGKVSAESAPREVLMSLPGMDEEAARRLIEARRAGPIEEKDLDRILPIHARAAKEKLKFGLSGIVRVRVEVEGDTRVVFEGLAVLGEHGIRALGLRPVI